MSDMKQKMFKLNVKNHLETSLYGPVHVYLNARLRQIGVDNTVKQHLTHCSFVYKGQFYNFDQGVPPLRRAVLLPELVPRMVEHIEEHKQIFMKEYPFVMGYVTHVLAYSDLPEDWCTLFPDMMTPLIKELMPLGYHVLDAETIERVQSSHSKGYQLLKERLTTNLLLT